MNAEIELQNIVFLVLYSLAIAVLAFFGLHKFFLLRIYNKHKNRALTNPPCPKEWPRVTVQLPIYNEKYVLKRLVRSIINFDYPRERLNIQVLDDSTDATSRLAQRLVSFLAKRGFRIEPPRF
jgi:cellulose synthase/poly-beta-1,6-N-acetylglucosamine synthase-like glycosyltransferase